MKSNLNTTDRMIRVILGMAILAVGIDAQAWWAALGVIPLLVAFIGWCPLRWGGLCCLQGSKSQEGKKSCGCSGT